MNFDELYPNTGCGEEFEFEGTIIAKGNDEYSCWNCGKKTKWFDLSFLAPLCSEECVRAKWEEFERYVETYSNKFISKSLENNDEF